LSNYQPSVTVVWKRFQEFYDKTLPYIDETQNPIIPEYAAGLAQFTSGRLHAFTVKQEDVIRTKKDYVLLLDSEGV